MPNQMRRDDGHRSFPKAFCPICEGRALDARNRAVFHAVKLLPEKDPLADFFIVCPKCHHSIGISVIEWHQDRKEPSPRQ